MVVLYFRILTLDYSIRPIDSKNRDAFSAYQTNTCKKFTIYLYDNISFTKNS